jgi:hypothetical protein
LSRVAAPEHVRGDPLLQLFDFEFVQFVFHFLSPPFHFLLFKGRH